MTDTQRGVGSRGVSRRRVLKAGAAAATAWWVGGTPLGAQDGRSPLERLNFACVGLGGKGASDSNDAAASGNVVAVCDVDGRTLAAKAAEAPFKDAKRYADFREMLDELGDRVDAVTVSTPDHTHAVVAAAALRAGKHVFCQKPLAWSVEESRTLRRLARERKADGVCTQMGIQGVASDRFREGVELLRSGRLGDVTEVHIWTNRPIWPQGGGRPSGSAEPPKEVNWDLWLGPAEPRPYHPTAYHPFNWRGWVDFGTGAIGDIACHTGALPAMGLNLFDPVGVSAESSWVGEGGETYPKASKIVFRLAERPAADGGTLAPCTLTWYDGGNLPDPSLLPGETASEGGGLLAVGTGGRFYAPHPNGMEWRLLAGANEVAPAEPSLPRVPRGEAGADPHFAEFARACRAGTPDAALANFEFSGRLTETFLLGNVALLAGGPVAWDGERVTNRPEAGKYLGREYREGWSL